MTDRFEKVDELLQTIRLFVGIGALKQEDFIGEGPHVEFTVVLTLQELAVVRDTLGNAAIDTEAKLRAKAFKDGKPNLDFIRASEGKTFEKQAGKVQTLKQTAEALHNAYKAVRDGKVANGETVTSDSEGEQTVYQEGEPIPHLSALFRGLVDDDEPAYSSED